MDGGRMGKANCSADGESATLRSMSKPTTAAIGGMGTEEISEWLQGGSCSQDLHA